MGHTKRHQRTSKPAPATRRTTRSSRSRLLSDPVTNTAELTTQLRQLGLYAADTLGDGNCLFRALSDQLYGSDAHHARLRQEICSWIEQHKHRYEPFVEDERGIDVHLRCMRTLATYGGHLELSAFAHMARRDVKVIQPGLVYVIEWASGWENERGPPPASTSSASSPSPTPEFVSNDRSRRAARRERRKTDRGRPPQAHNSRGDDESDEDDEDDAAGAGAASEPVGPIYVAYHDWEHFSSVRNLRGPHAGLPRVRERAPDDVAELPPAPPALRGAKRRGRPLSSTSLRAVKYPPAPTPAPTLASTPTRAPATPTQVPLPPSRSPSPLSVPPSARRRSPKRTFDESSASSQSSTASAPKRSRRDGDDDGEDEAALLEDAEDEDTPALSDISTLSSSPSPSPPPPPPPPPTALTQRQRKALGLPRPRPAGVGRSAGKIVIPGGKYRKPLAAAATSAAVGGAGADEGEWARNGTGRVDVRGFRELRI